MASAITHVAGGERQAVALVHQVADEFQPRAELAARMQNLEVARGEALALEQRDGEAIAERKLHHGRGGGRESVRAGFLGLRQCQHHFRSLGRARFRRSR